MLTLKMLKPLGALVKKIDLPALFADIEKIDVKKLREDKAEQERLGMTIVGAILPKIEDAADSVVSLVAAYENITEAEALELDLIAELKKLFSEQGLLDFFKSAAKLG